MTHGTTYYTESLVPLSLMEDPDYRRNFEAYLLSVMEAHEYRVLSPVVIAAAQDELVPPPEGMGIIRATVMVTEFDTDVSEESTPDD